MALFENYEGRMPQLQPVLDKYGFKDFEEVKAFTNGKGVDAYSIVESTQPICFENVKWAYELGAAIAMKEGAKKRCRPSASPAPLRTSARSVSATATWAPCCWTRRPSASLSWPAMNPLPPLKAQSKSR